MDDAVSSVKRIMSGTSITDAQIRDAVWTYYFDVDESVKSLRDILRKQDAKTKAKQKAAPEKGLLSSCSLSHVCLLCEVGVHFISPKLSTQSRGLPSHKHSYNGYECHSNEDPSSVHCKRLKTIEENLPLSFREQIVSPSVLFKDTPWDLSSEDLVDIFPCRDQKIRGGLLGGSSKLAALARARAAKRLQDSNSSVQEQDVTMQDAPPPERPVSTISAQSSGRLTALISDRNKASGHEAFSLAPSLSFEPQQTPSSSQSASAISAHSQAVSPPTIPLDLSEPSAIFSSSAPSGFALSLFHEILCDEEEQMVDIDNSSYLSSSTPSDRAMSHRDDIWRKITNSPLFYLPVSAKQVEDISKSFSKPSPDEVIKSARSTKGGTMSAAKSIEKGVASLAIKEGNMTTTVKQPQVNVVQEYKNSKRKAHVNFVVVGHVDAGKSTLMGRLLYDVGTVDERTLKKYQRESDKIGKGSFALAWVLDQSEEERERGVTVDISSNDFESSKVAFTILDAPGHQDFVPNMIAGASEADFAVLVIDASTNAFESGFVQSGQTKEHAILVRSLGIQRLIIAVNKLDNVNWAEYRYDEIKSALQAFFQAIGFPASQTSFIPCSGLSGDNIVNRSAEPSFREWYKGPTLLEELENLESIERDITGPLRISVSDVFKTNTSSLLNVSGRINSGNVQLGETVIAVPSMETVLVKSISSGEEKLKWAVAGDNIQIGITNVSEISQIRAGDILCSIKQPLQRVCSFVARVAVFQLRVPLIKGSNVLMYRGRTQQAGQIVKLISTVDKSTGKELKKKPRHLSSGQTALIELAVIGQGYFPTETFNSNKDIGRIVLRQEGTTVAAGIVEEIIKSD
ncbi:uncharacterized protein V1516DRAFT_668061 [Lipomyces oligophaga]|uniref:uncharacterized protein n=1 Tax=Lipomyces oligophaga TaxID=45792 RepID=UPI0034CDACF7